MDNISAIEHYEKMLNLYKEMLKPSMYSKGQAMAEFVNEARMLCAHDARATFEDPTENNNSKILNKVEDESDEKIIAEIDDLKE